VLVLVLVLAHRRSRVPGGFVSFRFGTVVTDPLDPRTVRERSTTRINSFECSSDRLFVCPSVRLYLRRHLCWRNGRGARSCMPAIHSLMPVLRVC
jgi:hypothetical protein